MTTHKVLREVPLYAVVREWEKRDESLRVDGGFCGTGQEDNRQ